MVAAPHSNIEREVKLDAELDVELPELTGVLPGVIAVPLPGATLQATYIDTVDLRLMRWGVTLRHRRDTVGGAGAESEWTVKLPGDADGIALVRTELSWPGRFGAIPSDVTSIVRAQARTAPLGPVAKLVTERRRVEVRDVAGRKLAEVDDDVVSVMTGRRVTSRFRQIEVEVTELAPDDLLGEAVKVLTSAGAVAGDDRPKVVRAIGPRASLGPDVVVAAVDRHSSVRTVISAAIGAGVTRLIRHDPGVRLGDDPEHVHQARVATRRLRSDLRTFRSLLDPDWVGLTRAELGWLAGALGEVRDADVLSARLRDDARALPSVDSKAAATLLRRLTSQREDARLRLLEALDGDRYLALLENLVHAAANPPFLHADSQPGAEVVGPNQPPTAPPLGATDAATHKEDVAERRAAGVLRPLVRRPWKHLQDAVDHLGDDPSDEALHRVRIRAKRLRYGAEAVTAVFGKPARNMASAVAGVQGVLGDMHDAVVAEAWLRDQATSSSASLALVAGELVAVQRQHQERCRASWTRPWKLASKKSLRRWLRP